MKADSPQNPRDTELSGRNGPPPRVNVKQGYQHLPSTSRLAVNGDPGSQSDSRGAVFLDRDGVLVEDVHFLKEPGQIQLLPGVPGALRSLQDLFCIIVVTNQSGIARGLFTEDNLLAIHTDLVNRLSAQGALVDDIYYCPHLPEASIAKYRVDCGCRKPRPGMLLRAGSDWGIDLTRSFLVGDRPRDVEAARAAGVSGIIVGESNSDREPSVAACQDLAQAADLILETVTSPDHHSALESNSGARKRPIHSVEEGLN